MRLNPSTCSRPIGMNSSFSHSSTLPSTPLIRRFIQATNPRHGQGEIRGGLHDLDPMAHTVALSVALDHCLESLCAKRRAVDAAGRLTVTELVIEVIREMTDLLKDAVALGHPLDVLTDPLGPRER